MSLVILQKDEPRWFFLIPEKHIFDFQYTMCILLSPIMNFCEGLLPFFLFSFPHCNLSGAFFCSWQYSYRSAIRCTKNMDSDFITQSRRQIYGGEKGQDKRHRCLHDHHVDFQSDVCKTLERNQGKSRVQQHSSISRIHGERLWFTLLTPDLHWCSWVKNLATYLTWRLQGAIICVMKCVYCCSKKHSYYFRQH